VRKSFVFSAEAFSVSAVVERAPDVSGKASARVPRVQLPRHQQEKEMNILSIPAKPHNLR